jgi:rubrerythrin
VSELRVTEVPVVDSFTVRGDYWMTHTAICPACGYPTVGPGVCASCRAVVRL